MQQLFTICRNTLTIYLICIACMCAALVTQTALAALTGSARIIDGDTLAIGQQVIRLSDIDAPENGQNCKDAKGQSYNCGAAAEAKLKTLVHEIVRCSGSTTDSYDRLIATCYSQGQNINRQMVLSGHAVVFVKYSDAYLSEQSQAKIAHRGIWAGTFKMPWEFRAKRWEATSAEAPVTDCPIKGNINRQGERIYHTPWSRSYARTKINTAKSERWFCSEAEALAAGWRAPIR